MNIRFESWSLILAGLGSLLPTVTAAQVLPAQSAVTVRSTSTVLSGARVTITVDGIDRTAVIGADGILRLSIPSSPRGEADFKVRIERIGLTALTWQGTVPLGESGQLEYVIDTDAAGAFVSTWPLITYLSSDATNLDIRVNGEIRGNTILIRSLAPDTNHLVQWMKGPTVVCTHTVRVPENVKRTFICNPGTGQVTPP